MAKTCGIHLSERRFELVALDGSAKRPKVRLCLSGVAPADAEDSLDAVGDALRGAAKAHRKQLAIEEIGLCIDSSLATYRFLSLPFADSEKIEEVLKFEVESQLPQWDIDDVVCDFLVLNSTPVESHLMVTAVPKDELAMRLDLAARAGLEPLDAELDSEALFRAAEHSELLDVDGAQLLVHFGSRATTVVTVDGGRLVGARALTLDLRAFDPSASVATVVADDGETVALEDPEAGTPDVGTPDVGPSTPPLDAARTEAVVQRVRRELGRTMSSLQGDHTVDKILVCGIEVPGIVGGEITGITVERLDPLEGQVDLPVEDRSRLVIAYGTALGRLGAGSIKPHLRREELAYASKFERLELPLGVLGLLALTLLASIYITNGRVLAQRQADVDLWLKANRNFMVGVPGTEYAGYLRSTAEDFEQVELVRYVHKLAEEGDTTRTYRQQLARVGSLLDSRSAEIQEQLGAARDITQPMSALSGLNMVLDVINELDAEGSLGRFSIRKATSEYLSGRRGNAGDRVKVELDLTFFGANDAEATQGYTALMRELANVPWITEETKRPSTTVLETGGGIQTDGIEIFVDTTKADPEN